MLLSFIIFGVFNTTKSQNAYPKLANYYLRFFNQSDYDTLAKWDLLVIQGG